MHEAQRYAAEKESDLSVNLRQKIGNLFHYHFEMHVEMVRKSFKPNLPKMSLRLEQRIQEGVLRIHHPSQVQVNVFWGESTQNHILVGLKVHTLDFEEREIRCEDERIIEPPPTI